MPTPDPIQMITNRKIPAAVSRRSWQRNYSRGRPDFIGAAAFFLEKPMNTTPILRSFPNVSSNARQRWQMRIARIASAELPGIGLGFCVRRLRQRRFVRLSQLHGLIVRQDGQAIRVTGFQGRRVPYGVAFDEVRYEVDLLKSPGQDSDRGVPCGHHELLLGTATQLAGQLVNRRPRWTNRAYFKLPRIYADFGDRVIPTPDGPEIESVCRRARISPSMLLSHDTVQHRNLRLVPLEYVGHSDASFDIYVETSSIGWYQPCGAAAEADLQLCHGAIEFNPLAAPDDSGPLIE